VKENSAQFVRRWAAAVTMWKGHAELRSDIGRTLAHKVPGHHTGRRTMARLGNGAEGMARCVALATLAPGGTVAVPAALVLDEMEHHRAGIGCMLESTDWGEVHVSVVVAGGAAHQSGLREGDVIESIDGQRLQPRGGVEQVSSLIRGPSGSYVELDLRRSGERFRSRIQRRAVPGGSAEILGTLFQGVRSSGPGRGQRELTTEDRVDMLRRLHRRGNLSDAEFRAAELRLRTGYEAAPTKQAAKSFSFTNVLEALGSDVNTMISDPEVLRRKKEQEQQQRRALSPSRCHHHHVPQRRPPSPSASPRAQRPFLFPKATPPKDARKGDAPQNWLSGEWRERAPNATPLESEAPFPLPRERRVLEAARQDCEPASPSAAASAPPVIASSRHWSHTIGAWTSSDASRTIPGASRSSNVDAPFLLRRTPEPFASLGRDDNDKSLSAVHIITDRGGQVNYVVRCPLICILLSLVSWRKYCLHRSGPVRALAINFSYFFYVFASFLSHCDTAW